MKRFLLKNYRQTFAADLEKTPFGIPHELLVGLPHIHVHEASDLTLSLPILSAFASYCTFPTLPLQSRKLQGQGHGSLQQCLDKGAIALHGLGGV